MKNSADVGVVFRSIISVFAAAVLTLGGVGVVVAFNNNRPVVAAALIFATAAVVIGSILAACWFLAKHDPEAYDLRRYD